LIKLFHSATISALKADIIRILVLYNEGGIWIDANTTLKNKNAIDILFERYKDFDFVITFFPYSRNDLSSSALISKHKSKLAFYTLCKIEENLLKHFQLESKTKNYIDYNLFRFVAPVVWFDLLDYKWDDEFRKTTDSNFVKDNENNVLTLNSYKFKFYNCGLMDSTKLLKFYGCNMEHHHGKNFHKHWSEVQKTQRLFDTNNY
jgi:hypothetical protein